MTEHQDVLKVTRRQTLVAIKLDSQRILDRLDEVDQHLIGALMARAVDELSNSIASLDSQSSG